MTTSIFLTLYDGVCQAAGIPTLPLASPEGRPLAFHLVRNAVAADVLYFPQACAGHAFVLIGFGQIPDDHPRVGEIVLALLHANFVFPHASPPAIGRNPATGDVVLRCVVPLADTTPTGLLEIIDGGVELALQWRQSYFLPADMPATGAGADMPSNALAV